MIFRISDHDQRFPGCGSFPGETRGGKPKRMSTLAYVKNFISDKYIASITPTSDFGVKKVCSKIDFSRCNLVVEYGPGTGVFTNYLLTRMGPDSLLIMIERNANFANLLRKKFRDPRAVVVNDCASNIPEILAEWRKPSADYVISGIPFSFLPPILKDRILRNSYTALRPGGKFLAYQTFYQSNNHLKAHLDKIFHFVRVEYEMLNLPPLRIYEARK
jgi:phospholipid N-methyltransferase